MAPASDLPATASAQAGGLELAVAVSGSVLHVELANRSDAAETVYFAAQGPRGSHHDFLTVALSGSGGERTLRFTGDRNASTIGVARLAPGESAEDDLDLQAWAGETINGATPLAAGDYALTATYRVDQPGAWAGSIVAGPVRLHV